jgi:hypothetical protein
MRTKLIPPLQKAFKRRARLLAVRAKIDLNGSRDTPEAWGWKGVQYWIPAIPPEIKLKSVIFVNLDNLGRRCWK